MSDFPCACEWDADDNLLALCGAHQEREDALRAEVERLTRENAAAVKRAEEAEHELDIHGMSIEEWTALRAKVERLTADNARKDDEIMALHQIGSMDDLREIARECAQRDYCSCAPCEMSYCVTQRFVAELQRKLDAAAPAGEVQRE